MLAQSTRCRASSLADTFGLIDMEHKELILELGTVKYSPEDAALVEQYVWHTYNFAKNGSPAKLYAQASVEGKSVYMHRLLAGAKGLEVDHINSDGLDNRRSNLRLATRQQNSANKPALGGTSVYKGVCKANTKSPRWRAWVMSHKKSLYLGSFKTEIEAAKAYDVAAKREFGAFAILNF